MSQGQVQLLERDTEYRARFLAAEALINHHVGVNADAAFRLSGHHVVYNTTAQNLSDAAIQNQIDALNRDFSESF